MQTITHTEPSKKSSLDQVLQDPDFKKLMQRKTRVSIGLTFATILVYFGFIFLVAFKKTFLAQKVTENITLGIPVGIGVILATCFFTGIYVLWANKKYDPEVQSYKQKLGEG